MVKAYRQQDYQRTLVILLEDFGGESLEQWMRQQSGFCPMSLPAFLRLAIALTDILGSIHANTIIHKDINPGNIVFNPDTGVVKMIDFGIATRFNRTNPTFKSHYSLEAASACSEMLLVSGYAGIGKSALVQKLYKPITQKRGYFISGKFDQLQRNIPYSAIADALQKLVQQLLGEPDE